MRVALASVAALVVLALCAACYPSIGREQNMEEIAAIEEAIAGDVERVETVEAERDTSGTSTGYIARITVAEATPFTAAELAGVLTAMRTAAPERAGYFGVLVNTGARATRRPLELETAADELGVRYGGFFTGIMVSSMDIDGLIAGGDG